MGTSAEIVRLTHFAETRDTIAIPNDTIGMCLFNLDEERILKTPGLQVRRNGDRVAFQQPEVRLNLYLLFAANFRQYSEALRFIGWTVAFFQSRRVFNHRNTPTLPPTVSEMAVDMYAMTLEQQNYLWSMLGIRYLPSVAYQVRPVVIQEAQVESEQVPVMEIDLRTQGGG